MDFSKETYSAFLDTPAWRKFRLEFIRKKGYRCEKCGKELKRGLQVHHKIYREGLKPWEYPSRDLQCLCVDCHHSLHLRLLSRGKRIPLVNGDGLDLRPFIKGEDLCRHCGGTGLIERYRNLLGGLCFHCFGTGIGGVHRYTKWEARRYGLKIYNDWLRYHESDAGRIGSDAFDSPEDVENWLLSMNGD